VEFLEKDVDLEEELKEFEGEFERDEVVEVYNFNNKILFSVKKLFVTMFVIFSLVRKIKKLRFKKL
jgi:hypothetical protein